MLVNATLAEIAYIFILSVAAALGLFVAQLVGRGQLLLVVVFLVSFGSACRFVVPQVARLPEARKAPTERVV